MLCKSQMACEKEELIEVLVADSAAFLKTVQLQSIARNIYTVQAVIQEIKSAAVREQLAVLPYEINFRTPSSESLHVVSEFAKKTGDYQSLSIVDLNVLALTYQLHKENCGTEDLRKEPTKQVEVIDKQHLGKIPGFFIEKKNSENKAREQCENDGNEDLTKQLSEFALADSDREQVESSSEGNQDGECIVNKDGGDGCDDNKDGGDDDKDDGDGCDDNKDDGDSCDDNKDDGDGCDDNKDDGDGCDDNKDGGDGCDDNKDDGDGCDDNKDDGDGCDDNKDDGDNDDDSDDDEDDRDDDEDDDDGDWINPSNISKVKADFGMTEQESKPSNVAVGCLTTDFAMQNVLIQMGLHVISVDGMLIREARSYVLKCYACFKVTSQMQRMFCPKCGNRTLVKVSVSVDANGITRYHMPRRRKPFSTRGKQYPLPLPKGGRHSNNPILFEDQLISQKRLPKPKDKVNVFDEDYVTRVSPFAAKDTTSRAFNLGFHMHGANRRNPNEARKKTRRKKR